MRRRRRHPPRPGSAPFWLIGLAFCLSPVGPARADAFRTPPMKQGAPVSIGGYGRQNPNCREWTNGCVLCTSNGGTAQCSTPGIACTPAGITCKRQAR